MYFTAFWRLFVVSLVFRLYCVTTVTPFPGRGGGVFFGWICAARDRKLAPRSKKSFP